MYGWMGTILRVDLTSGKITKEPLDPELGANYIGGRGINVRMLYDEVPAGLDGYDPENRLVFGTGPLTGTMLATGRLHITGKSPLSGILGDSNGGSHFAPELKYAGYDHIVFTGKAEKPVYLLITNDRVELRDAQHLWGRLCDSTIKAVREELGDPGLQVSCIGPAGENLVRFACVAVGDDGFCGKCGLGALMGSKKLKAVAVRGTGGVKVPDTARFRDLAMDLQKKALKNPAYADISLYGTTRLFRGVESMGVQAIRNSSQAGRFAGYANMSPEVLREKYAVRSKACFGCLNHCRSWYEIKEGPYAGDRGVGIEFACQLAWAVLCDNGYAPSLYMATKLCNQYGLDIREMGMLLAAAMEWREKGFLSDKDTDGIDLTWGNHQAMIAMCHKVARREGAGDLFAEGAIRLARKLGKAAEGCLTQVKGVTQTNTDVRWNPSYMLGLATAPRGADHLRGAAHVGINPSSPAEIDYENAPQGVHNSQNICTLADSLGICKFATSRVRMTINPAATADLFAAATGIETDEAGMKQRAARIWTLERAFIVREGITRKDDHLIGRLANEPMHGGTFDGVSLDPNKWEATLDKYYDLSGWDRKTGVPTRATLESLGLKAEADELQRAGKL